MATKPTKPPKKKKAPKKPTKREPKHPKGFCTDFNLAVFDITIEAEVLKTITDMPFKGRICLCEGGLKITMPDNPKPCRGADPCS